MPARLTYLGASRPTIAILLFGALAGAASLFLVETMSSIHENESFQATVEYSTVAHLYLGDKIHILMQILLYCALQSVNISSIIISEQVRGPPYKFITSLTRKSADYGFFTRPTIPQDMCG